MRAPALIAGFLVSWLWLGWRASVFADLAFRAIEGQDYSGLGVAKADFHLAWFVAPLVALIASGAIYYCDRYVYVPIELHPVRV